MNFDPLLMPQLVSHYGEKVNTFSSGEISYSVKKDSHLHKDKGHITAFITSYQRMMMLEQLLTME
jgi:hypothetical protein